MTLLIRHKYVQLILVLISGLMFLGFSVQAQAALAVYLDPGSTTPFVNNSLLDFGGTLAGTPVTRTLWIANEGTALLTVDISPVSAGFSRSANQLQIQPGQSQALTISCNATAAGNYNGVISFDTNAGGIMDFVFAVTCTVNGPRIAVYTEGGAAPVPENTTFDFGATTPGTPISRTFTIANEGTAALNPGTITVPAGFTLTTTPAASVGAAATTTFTVLCDALSEGPYSGTLSIPNNDPARNPYQFTIACTVSVPAPDIALYDGGTPIPAGGAVDLGATTPGTPISRTFTIANEGTAALNPGTITVPAGFTLTTTPAASVGAAGSTSFEVQCDASDEGTFSGTVSVPSNDPNENPYTFTISCVVDTQPTAPTPPPPTARARVVSFPTPPATNTCMEHNFVTNSGVRAGVPDEFSGRVFCRMLVQDGDYIRYLGHYITSGSNIGSTALEELGIQQAVDIFSPTGPNYYTGGIVICLRGTGHLIYLNANRAPHIPEIVGSYTVPEFPGFTCLTLFEPGTLLLVRRLPE